MPFIEPCSLHYTAHSCYLNGTFMHVNVFLKQCPGKDLKLSCTKSVNSNKMQNLKGLWYMHPVRSELKPLFSIEPKFSFVLHFT